MKTLVKNTLMLSAIATLVFLSCDRRTTEERWQAEIRYFFMQHQEDYQSYEPLSFQKIDLAFLESQEPIQKALLVLQDTTRQRVKQLYLANLSDQVESISSFSENFSIDRIDDYLKTRALAEGLLSKKIKNSSSAYQQALTSEQSALDLLENILSQFSLSIYSLDFENDPVIYFHQYKLDDEERSAVFELDRESAEVISFREMNS